MNDSRELPDNNVVYPRDNPIWDRIWNITWIGTILNGSCLVAAFVLAPPESEIFKWAVTAFFATYFFAAVTVTAASLFMRSRWLRIATLLMGIFPSILPFFCGSIAIALVLPIVDWCWISPQQPRLSILNTYQSWWASVLSIGAATVFLFVQIEINRRQNEIDRLTQKVAALRAMADIIQSAINEFAGVTEYSLSDSQQLPSLIESAERVYQTFTRLPDPPKYLEQQIKTGFASLGLGRGRALFDIPSETFESKKARFDRCLESANQMVRDARDNDLEVLTILKS